jgi:H+/Cl- antiporter ClcA
MELFVTLILIGIIFIIFVWLLEIPALLVRFFREHDSWDQIFESLIILTPALLFLLPFLLLGYRWYQLGEILLEISDAIHKGSEKRMG